jgi:oxaloacetate decarboxylase alpha subunit
MALLKAIEADVDGVDTSISPLAMGTSHTPTEALVATLQGTPHDSGLSLEKLDVVAKYFNTIREKYLASGLIDPKVLKVDVNALRYQVPGGMLSNLISQLKMAGKSDKLEAVLEEVARVREDAGFPPLVTPSSQIVGTQAVMNVIGGERYKMVTKEFKGLVRGEYGKTPLPISDEIKKKIIGDEKQITCRPADNIKPELERLRSEIAEYLEQDEDVLSYALFDQVAVKFFEKRKAEKYKLSENTDFDNKVTSI